MTWWLLAPAVGALFVLAAVGWRMRHAINKRLDQSVIFKVRHVYLWQGEIVGLILLLAITTAIAREQRSNARDEQLRDRFSLTVTKRQVMDLARDLRRYSRDAARRTAVDIFRDCVRADASVKGCRGDLAREIDEVFRVTPEGRIVAREGSRPPAARVTVESRGQRIVVRERIIERGPAGPRGPQGPKGDDGRDGHNGKDASNGVDSTLVNTLDARVRDLEQITGGLTRRLQRALSLLCPLVRALCT